MTVTIIPDGERILPAALPSFGVRERAGHAIGQLLAPVLAMTSRLRGARTFHPVGQCFTGTCERLGRRDHGDAELAALAARLEGRVLARCSGALWKRQVEHVEVLGLSLRFRRGNGVSFDEHARPGDQDLLTATVRSPLTLLAAPFFTDARDFLANRYWAVSPFAYGSRRYELRFSPIDPPRGEGDRLTRLLRAVDAGRAAWWLEARRTLRPRWHRIARVAIERAIEIDQEALRFDPFRDGAGLEPVGLVHAIRRATYAASRAGRAAATAR